MEYKTSEWIYFSLETFLLPWMVLSLCLPKGHWKNRVIFWGSSRRVPQCSFLLSSKPSVCG